MTDSLRDDEAGAIRVGPTDAGMVRLIIVTHAGVFDLDFPPEEAEEIAEELRSSAEIARAGTRADRPRRDR